jgi:hypothetical protein
MIYKNQPINVRIDHKFIDGNKMAIFVAKKTLLEEDKFEKANYSK